MSAGGECLWVCVCVCVGVYVGCNEGWGDLRQAAGWLVCKQLCYDGSVQWHAKVCGY